jgi:hypothetical protein
MFRLYDTIKQIVMKYLQVAPFVKLKRFTNVVILGTLHGVVAKALRYNPEIRGSNPDSGIGISC